MVEWPSTDPFFPGESPVPQVPEHAHKRHDRLEEWTAVDRVAGEGARSRLESEERHLGAEGILARIEHDDQGRLVLEVPADRKHDALKVIG
jgi:hypothetical protein